MQQLALQRLRTQVVPFVILPSEYRDEFRERFPLVAAYVQSRYASLSVISTGEDEQIELFVDTMLPAARRDPQTGWPCYADVPAPTS